MSERRSSADPAPDASENVVRSVTAAARALRQLEDSLLRAGFPEGQEAYMRMSELLVGQRMWAAESGHDLDADFEHLARLAASIYSILKPYLEAMQRMAALAEIEKPSLERRLLERLAERRGRAVSVAVLASELGMERSEVEKALRTLLAEGRVETRRSSGRTLFSLPRAGASVEKPAQGGLEKAVP
jgi:biotin operon repressor